MYFSMKTELGALGFSKEPLSNEMLHAFAVWIEGSWKCVASPNICALKQA